MPAMREDSQSAAKGSEPDLLSHIAPEIRVLEKHPTSLCELLIPICTEAYQKDGNLRDETQILGHRGVQGDTTRHRQQCTRPRPIKPRHPREAQRSSKPTHQTNTTHVELCKFVCTYFM
jgi:hypothetical protein